MELDVFSVLASLAGLLAAALFASYIYVTATIYQYFKKRGVPYEKPTFPFGSFSAAARFKKSFPAILAEMHFRHRSNKVVGFFAFLSKSMLITDRDVIRHVLIKDFNKFDDRGMHYDKQNDPLSAHLFALDGPEWRPLRAKLSPSFSSGKLKGMLPLIVACAGEMNEYAAKTLPSDGKVNIKPLLAKFGISVVSTTAFGLESDAFSNEDSMFVNTGLKVFETTIDRVMRSTLVFNVAIAKFLRLRFLPESVSDFFRNTVRRTLELRKSEGIVRDDFFQLLIQLMESTGDFGLTEDEVAAEAFVFLLGGFETTSTTICFCLLELAANAEIQRRVLAEVDAKGDVITYDSLNEMTYLEMAVDETLRKYPPVPFLARRCNEDYQIPGSETRIDKGTMVFMSNLAIQNDPDLFPEPERFIPERFSKENKSNIKPYSYMPFGDGPRYCIGSRFGKLVTKAGLASLLRRFEVRPVAGCTPDTIVFDPRATTLTARGGVWMRLVPRQS